MQVTLLGYVCYQSKSITAFWGSIRNICIHQIKQFRCVPYNMSSVNPLQMHIILHLFHRLLVHSSSFNMDTSLFHCMFKAYTHQYKYKPLRFLFNIISKQIFLWMNIMLGLSQTVRNGKQAKKQHENISIQLNLNLQPLAPQTGALKIKRPPLMV